MKKQSLLLVLFTFISGLVFSQTETLLEFDGEKVSKQEFLELYNKNNPNIDKSIDKADLDEYLELYINYRLKLRYAKDKGLDKDPNYLREVDTYRQQLVEPYINDREVTEALVMEAYERSQEFVRASHILLELPINFTPQDTLDVYNRAVKLRDRIIAGESFEDLAEMYSNDPSAKTQKPREGQKNAQKGNKGDLGYFTSFSMIYPFESAVYGLEVGEISMPVRTNRGYHIIYLRDRMPAFFSSCDLAHIWINFDNYSTEEEAKSKIMEANAMLNRGVVFDSVAKLYSDDLYSKDKKGRLEAQRVTTLPPEYIEKIKVMSIGELSKPFETKFGWHIIMPLELRPIPSLEQQRAVIEGRISKDSRSFRSIEEFIRKAKEEYGFVENIERIKPISDIITDSVFEGSWTIPINFEGDEVVFTIADESYTQMDIARFIEDNQNKQDSEYIPAFVDKAYRNFANSRVLHYADQKLEDKHPDLKASIDEFRDGILIFTVTDNMVWTKSITDSIGLESFYNKNKYNYMWKDRVDATVFSFHKDANIKKARKLVRRNYKKKKTNAEIVERIASKLKIKDNIDEMISYTWNKYERSSNNIVDRTNWELGVSEVIEEGKRNYIVINHSILPPQPKEIDEARGVITSHYQTHLEKEWIEDLRKTYSYKVNYEVYNTIK